MATPNPSNLKSAQQQAEELARSLKQAAEAGDDINFSFNLTNKLLGEIVKKEKDRRTPNSFIAKFSKNIAKSLNEAVDTEDRIHILKKKISELNRMEAAQTRRGVSISQEQLDIQESLNDALRDQEELHNFQQVGMERIYGKIKAFQAGFHRIGQNIRNAGNILVNKFSTGTGIVSTLMTKLGKGISAAGAGISTMATAMGIGVAGAILIAIALAKKVWEIFKKWDEEATKFRMSMGMTKNYTKGIDIDARRIAASFTDIGVKFEHIYESAKAIVQTMGSMISYSRGIGETISIFTSQLGISAEKSAQLFKSFGMISKNTMASQKNMMYFTAALSEAAGTNLSEVMGDIAEFTQSHYRFMARSVPEMIKAAVVARRMGTSLSSAGKSAESLLNFTQSINDEMEASVLLGRSIDLQRARTLAYARDTVGLNKEILRLAQQHDFESMDPFQVQAFAKALGKSEEEIAKILQTERERRDIQRAASKDPHLKKQLADYKKLMGANQEMAKASAKDYESKLKTRANQERMVALQNQWNKLIQELATEWLPVIHDALTTLIPVVKGVTFMLKLALQPVIALAKMLSGIVQMMKGDFTGGLKTTMAGVTKVFLGPFSEKMDKIYQNWFESHSPHKLGQAFIDGFVAAEKPIENALMNPIKRSLEYAQQSLLGTNRSTVAGSRPAPVTLGGIKENSSLPSLRRTTKNEEGVTMARVTEKISTSIDKLIENFRTGQIAANVYVDSQKLSLATERATRFRNGYGTNDATAF